MVTSAALEALAAWALVSFRWEVLPQGEAMPSDVRFSSWDVDLIEAERFGTRGVTVTACCNGRCDTKREFRPSH